MQEIYNQYNCDCIPAFNIFKPWKLIENLWFSIKYNIIPIVIHNRIELAFSEFYCYTKDMSKYQTA